MTEIQLIEWLQQQHSTLDRVIANAGKEFHRDALKGRSKEQFGFDLAECQFESYNLFRNQDLCYDRPNTALSYSLWYHGRRVNTFLSYFAKTIFNTVDKQIEIFDLGAGTGAVQWAVGLVYHKMKEAGKQVPKIKIINIDTSPFMLYYSRDYLWKYFVSEYKHCQDFSDEIEYKINSWDNSNNLSIVNPWITASYLFDISDTSTTAHANTEYKNAIHAGFKELIKTFNPSTILLLTSDQPPKRLLLNELKQEFTTHGYNQQEVSYTQLLLTGQLTETSNFRKELFQEYREYLNTNEAQSIGRVVEWKDYSFVGTILSKQQSSLNLEIVEQSKKTKDIQLYNSPIKVRRDIVLNDDQKKAAEHTERPTIITGPAGCGKSVVITEKIKNLIEAKNYDKSLDILVTTFNKQLMSYLGNWIENLLDKKRVSRQGIYFKFDGSDKPNITLLHFDILPTRLGIGISKLPIGFNEYHSALLDTAIAELKIKKNITTNKYDDVLNPDFLLDEYHRIVYGLDIAKIESYLDIDRTGRPKRLKKGYGGKRELIAEIIFNLYLPKLQKESFTTKRHRFLQQLKRNEVSKKYTHIFVDEFQDCTSADYEIFNYLLTDANNFVLAGDVAQAIQLGTTLSSSQSRKVLRIRTRDEMRNFETFILKGSYRLPFRIAEALQNISAKNEDEESTIKTTLTPYKGSPPGARPIVIYAKTSKELESKIKSVYEIYKLYGLEHVTILETDYEICSAMRTVNIACETDTILKLKGLEKTCVLWSTRQDIEYKEEVSEFVYTILSRTSGILLILLTTQTLKKYHKTINLLRKDRLILWDGETKNSFDSFCNDEQEIEPLDEED